MKKVSLLLFIPYLAFNQVQIGEDINGENGGDRLGSSVSLSSSGNIIAIGVPRVNTPNTNEGVVKVLENISGVWTQIGENINGENINEELGSSVSLSSDGTTVVISGLNRVKVYENISGVWTQVGSTINIQTNASFPRTTVSLSSDGNVIAIGEVNSTGSEPYIGNVRVYENISGVWTQVGTTINGDQAGDYFGFSISLSSDGSIVAIGAPQDNGDFMVSGYVRIYKNISGIWTQIGSTIYGEGGRSEFGSSVSLSLDGNIIAIGAPRDVVNGSTSQPRGRVKVYENISGVWTQEGQDIIGTSSLGRLGSAVSLSSDGSIVAIGAPFNNNNGLNSGQVRIYENVSGVWTQLGSNINGENPRDESGSAISLSSNGSVIAIGARFNDGDANEGSGSAHGHVRVYDLSNILSLKENNLNDFKLYPNPVKNELTIQLNNTTELESVTIYNALGQEVLISTESIINTSKLASGSYVVKVKTLQGVISKKLIIE